MTLLFPNALAVELSAISLSVPPTITPGLNVKFSIEPSSVRKSLRIRAASKIAPSPYPSRNICEECAGRPVTSRYQPIEPRRENHTCCWIAITVFKTNCNIGPLCRSNQIFSGKTQWITTFLFVASQNNFSPEYYPLHQQL